MVITLSGLNLRNKDNRTLFIFFWLNYIFKVFLTKVMQIFQKKSNVEYFLLQQIPRVFKSLPCDRNESFRLKKIEKKVKQIVSFDTILMQCKLYQIFLFPLFWNSQWLPSLAPNDDWKSGWKSSKFDKLHFWGNIYQTFSLFQYKLFHLKSRFRVSHYDWIAKWY